jgi:hypothetical protein
LSNAIGQSTSLRSLLGTANDASEQSQAAQAIDAAVELYLAAYAADPGA